MRIQSLEQYVKDEQFLLDQEYEIISSLVKIRDEKGVSQKKLSEAVKISQPSLARLESKRVSPGIDTMIKILAPLGYTLTVVPIEESK